MKLSAIIILLGLLFQTNSTFIFSTLGYSPTSFYQCIKPSANNRILIQFRYFLYDFYQEDMDNIKNAHEAGLNIEIDFYPTRCREPEEQVSFLMETFKDIRVDKFWVTLWYFYRYEKCTWWGHFSPEENCLYLQRLLAEFQKLGVEVGIHGQNQHWIDAFKVQTACPEIGGWKSPYMQKITTTSICGRYLYFNKVLQPELKV